MAPSEQTFKVKLSSGRILGPLTLDRVSLLIRKNKIVGTEVAREYPQGEWKDITQIPALAELLIQKAEGKLPSSSETRTLRGNPYDPTALLPGAEVEASSMSGLAPLPDLEAATGDILEDATVVISSEKGEAGDQDEEKTRLNVPDESSAPDIDLAQLEKNESSEERSSGGSPVSVDSACMTVSPRNIAQEKTVVFQRSSQSANGQPGRRKLGAKGIIKVVVLSLALGVLGYQFLFEDTGTKKTGITLQPIRPKLPAYVQGKSDSVLSQKIYNEALPEYLSDTVIGYRKASEKLLRAAGQDITNVKALALLASCYINLIDSSNKDENYFSVISKLIDMSRAKAAGIPETVIADVEFYITTNKPEAAQNRIVEYSKNRPFDKEMFFYLAYAFYSRGDAKNAARYLNAISDNNVFSPRVFYLRGQIAEQLGDVEAALREYQKAVQLNKQHAKSHLRIADILGRQGKHKDAAAQIEFIVKNPNLLAPKDLARGYYLHAQLSQLFQKWDVALGDMERAVQLDLGNHDYLLELYTLRAKAGDPILSVQKKARMYYFLGEGERQLKEGKYQEALAQFLQARQADLKSPVPPVKIGDMFNYMHDLANARLNYEIAAKNAPDNIEVWSKYINALIQSYEWEEAQKAMDKFRKLPVSQSAIDKAAGDMYAKQGRHAEAQLYYKKAMARDSIDSDVYISYAKSLLDVKNYKDAPFFFSLALRFDPLNVDALIGVAKAIAGAESIDRAINMLQDELQKGMGSKAELLAAIAEFEMQRGEWTAAQQYVDQAMQINPDYAYPWKLQAQIYMNREGSDKTALDKAMAAYKSYSDRNASDPSGYLERYRVFVRKAEYEKAAQELAEIYRSFPKYPNYHYFRGALYAEQGNHKVAAEEYLAELRNNPNGVNTLLALGKEQIELGLVDDALKNFNKAMQLAPKASEPKYQSGYANYLLKNFQGAVALYNAALAYDKGNPLIYKRMGMAYRDMGDPVSARTAFRKYLEMEPDAPDKREFQQYL